MASIQTLAALAAITLAKFAWISFLLVLPLAAVLTWMERRQSAYMQDRYGPTRAHFVAPGGKPLTLFGLVHIIADATKMLFKEPFMPQGADKLLFQVAPAIGFASSLVIIAFVPFGPSWQVGAGGPWEWVDLCVVPLDAGLLWIFAAASLGIYGTALAGFGSNNKFALLGGLRASAQIISYEVALGLTLVGMLLMAGTTDLQGIVATQGGSLWGGAVPRWGIVLQPVGAMLYLIAAMAETKRAPFDMPEGESEIIGYFLEYSSMGFGLFMLGEFVEVVVLSALFVTLFLGGWALPWHDVHDGISLLGFTLAPGTLGFSLFGFVVFAVKVVVMCAFQLQVRWSLPRFRYDQLMDVGWKMLLPLALANVAISAGLVHWDPSLHAMAAVGLGAVVLFVLFTVAGPKKAATTEGEVRYGH